MLGAHLAKEGIHRHLQLPRCRRHAQHPRSARVPTSRVTAKREFFPDDHVRSEDSLSEIIAQGDSQTGEEGPDHRLAFEQVLALTPRLLVALQPRTSFERIVACHEHADEVAEQPCGRLLAARDMHAEIARHGRRQAPHPPRARVPAATARKTGFVRVGHGRFLHVAPMSAYASAIASLAFPCAAEIAPVEKSNCHSSASRRLIWRTFW